MTMKDITLLKNELDLQTMFADKLLKELGEILSRGVNGKVLKQDEPRAREIEEILKDKKAWIAKAQKQIKAFYRPAMVA